MPHAGLDRTHGAETRVGGEAAEGARHGTHLDGIAESCTRCRRFHVADRARVYSGFAEIILDELPLRLRARNAVAGGAAGVIDRRALDDTKYDIAIGKRIGERLEQHRADAFRWQVAIAAGECAAAAMAADEARLAQADVFVWMYGEVHGAGNGEPALAPPQSLAGEMHGFEPRRAHGVHGHARTLKIKKVRDAIGERRVGCEREQRTIAGVLRFQGAILLRHRPDEDADLCTVILLQAAAADIRRVPAHARLFRGTGAPAGPCARPRAARCRRRPHRTHRRWRESRPSGSSSCPARPLPAA